MDKKITYTGRWTGKSRTNALDEIRDAYYYLDHQYLLEDARRHLDNFVYGDCDPDEMEPEEKDSCLQYVEEHFGISYTEMLELLEDMVGEYEQTQDCNIAENTTWVNAVYGVLCEASERRREKS